MYSEGQAIRWTGRNHCQWFDHWHIALWLRQTDVAVGNQLRETYVGQRLEGEKVFCEMEVS